MKNLFCYEGAVLFNTRYFCSLGPHLKKIIKMFTYDDQTSHGVSTILVLWRSMRNAYALVT